MWITYEGLIIIPDKLYNDLKEGKEYVMLSRITSFSYGY